MKLFLSLLILFSSVAKAEDFQAEKYKGKIVYLDFWASWCAPCKDSFPWLNQVQKKYQDKGVVVIGINVDKDKAKAEEFLKKIPAQFQIYYNADGTLAQKYKVQGMPFAVIIGKNGEVIHSHIGFHPDKTKEYEQIIEGALK